MKRPPELLINLPLYRQFKNLLPFKVLFLISQLQSEKEQLLKKLEQERGRKIPSVALTRINQFKPRICDLNKSYLRRIYQNTKDNYFQVFVTAFTFKF